MVRAKFKVTNVEPLADGDGASVHLLPVVGGSAENDAFYKYTPSGEIKLSTVNAAAASQFEVGKSFYVDFSPAE